MRKVILYVASSIDGFIAKSDGSVDWLHDPGYALEGEDYGYANLNKLIDTTLMGYSTFREIMNFDVPFPYQDKTNYVFTRKSREEHEFVSFISDDIIGFVQGLKKSSGKDIWLIGGGEINALLLENGLIDRIILTLIPVTIGAGIPLFANHSVGNNFILQKNESYKSGLCQLTYDLKN